MAKSKKRIEKSIESYEKLIQEHKGKKETYGGSKDYLKEYWEKQIKTFEKEREKQEKKLKK
jgi:hypothetical protein